MKVLLLLMSVIVVHSQEGPFSPCEDIYDYEIPENYTNAIINAPNPPPVGSTLVLQVTLAVNGTIPQGKKGKLELPEVNWIVEKRMEQNIPIRYRVVFPEGLPTPVLVRVIFNKQIICNGTESEYMNLTMYDLNHIFRSKPPRARRTTTEAITMETTTPVEIQGTSSTQATIPLDIIRDIFPDLVPTTLSTTSSTTTESTTTSTTTPTTTTSTTTPRTTTSTTTPIATTSTTTPSTTIPSLSTLPTTVLTTTPIKIFTLVNTPIIAKKIETATIQTPINSDILSSYQISLSLKDFIEIIINSEGRKVYNIPRIEYIDNDFKNYKYPKPLKFNRRFDINSPKFNSDSNRYFESSNLQQCGMKPLSTAYKAWLSVRENQDDWPWLVAILKLQANGVMDYVCSGTLISDRLVLTAASCVTTARRHGFKADDPSNIVLRLGAFRIDDNNEDSSIFRSVSKIKVRRDYGAHFKRDNNLAILEMNHQVPFTEYLKPICLCEEDIEQSNIINESGSIVTFVRDNVEDYIQSDAKNFNVPIVDTSTCRGINPYFYSVTSSRTLCGTITNEALLCDGATGAGLYIRNGNQWFIRGVVSNTLQENEFSCSISKYIVFTDIAQYLKWIKSEQ